MAQGGGLGFRETGNEAETQPLTCSDEDNHVCAGRKEDYSQQTSLDEDL